MAYKVLLEDYRIEINSPLLIYSLFEEGDETGESDASPLPDLEGESADPSDVSPITDEKEGEDEQLDTDTDSDFEIVSDLLRSSEGEATSEAAGSSAAETRNAESADSENVTSEQQLNQILEYLDNIATGLFACSFILALTLLFTLVTRIFSR